jgi:uncharacterized repeat protein (TIGR01451 family)
VQTLAARLILAALFAMLSICVPSAAFAQTAFNYTNTTDGAIPDVATPVCSNQLVRTFNVTDTFKVGDLNVGILLAHSFRRDLSITLQAPAASGGTTITLVNRHGGGADNINMLLDDANANAITGHTTNDTATATTVAPPWEETTFRPNAPLSTFNGITANGTWTLRICDNEAGDIGTFYQANLNFTSAPPPPVNYTDLSLAATVLSSVPPTASATGTVTYRLSATNAATANLNATGVTVGGAFPAASLIYVSDTGGGAYAAATGVWTVGALNIGQTKTIDVTFLVMAQTGTITSGAQVTAQDQVDFDSTPNNGINAEDDSATVAFSPTARTAGTPPTITCPVGSSTFDWGANTWLAGSLNNSYNLAGVGNFNIVMSSTTPYVAGSPAINGNLTGGVAGEVSLFQNLNNNALSDIATTVITMPGGLPGMQFRLFDIDFGSASYADKIVVTGSYQGNTVIPVLTNGTANYVVGNTAIGDVSALDTTAAGNVVVTFNAPVDTVTIIYGNHTTAPANPGNQWIGLGDLTFCNSYTSLSVTKVSSVVSDPVTTAAGGTNPKAIPGAVVKYCILISNTGTSTMTNVSTNDNIPVNLTFVPGSMRSGTNCNAATVEDDNAIGADETDPFGMSITGSTVNASATSIAGSASFALTFNAIVN